MPQKKDLISFGRCGLHKGFYHDKDIMKSLSHIRYTDYFEYPDDEYFPYDSAAVLLKGSCNHFAVSLHKILGYNPYIIKGKNNKGFHAFCQIYRSGIFYYVDARGITTSFDEFMTVASEFVSDEFTINPVTEKDIEEWETNSEYDEEAYAFAEEVIKEYIDYYTL